MSDSYAIIIFKGSNGTANEFWGYTHTHARTHTRSDMVNCKFPFLDIPFFKEFFLRLRCACVCVCVCVCVAFSSCLVSGWPIMKLVCAGVARGSIFAAGGVAYIYTPELYPTEIRARGTSAAYACARVGGFFSSYFMFGHLPTRVKIFTLVAVAVGAASLTSFIPKETAGNNCRRSQ